MRLDIDHVAKLAKLPLSKEEKELLEPQLNQIVNFIEKLNEVDTESVEPTFQVTGKTNELREDVVAEGLTQDQAIKNAPNADDGYIVTKGVFVDG
ncbi:Asp-tRNA(Asn)/Glu-tRNA(Gln) amidotransferase subunit GatC [candidate division WWE3 bacterium]|uniref:Aspartyl/glutamyl-tRNA(Asn/Gln) amidotransferase subunit C n=1 Tax=candidate division WWE3 bacterium TaxID=2053526 RepID=A0A955LKJ4_UNCKA|nr:Asp-tRNA(Asn)/Glu-tRNA(Gln) amidotransferase subunit GatC [candidate division WWE3 bacterium]